MTPAWEEMMRRCFAAGTNSLRLPDPSSAERRTLSLKK